MTTYYGHQAQAAVITSGLMDHINRTMRHCRIGKVKTKPHGVPYVPSDILRETMKPRPTTFPIMPQVWQPKPDPSDPCAGCFGKACGNVACPKRAVVTC